HARPHLALPSFPTRRSSDLSILALLLSVDISSTIDVVFTPSTSHYAAACAMSTCGAPPPILVNIAPSAPSTSASRLTLRPRCWRSEEHTSELQSRGHLVCRL